jgi:uncharacterized membrane protein
MRGRVIPGGVVYLRRVGIGQLFLALSFIVIGAICLWARDFLLYQEPVPQGIPGRETLALISAALMLFGGIGLLLPATAKRSALILTALVALWVLVLELPRALAHPLVEVNWLGVGEDSSLMAGAWLIYCAAPSVRAAAAAHGDASVRIARIVFGVALVPIGLSHFFYIKDAVALVPTWMPLRAPLTYLGGAGHIAAGLAIAFGVVPRLAATLEAGMQTLFTLICWVSAVVVAPADRQAWVNLCISTAVTAAAWAVAESYDRRVGVSALDLKPT